MRPIDTTYQLAISSKDYRDCHRLMQAEEGLPDMGALSFPTVMARRDGKLVGFLSTHNDNRYVIAGPLIVKGMRNPMITLRLVEAYDMIMLAHGIKLYYFSVDANRKDAFSREKLESLGMKFWEQKDDTAWYKKELR
jgi:hypothetical protein